MQQTLISKLHEYIRQNNPDFLVQLEEDGKVVEYLLAKINVVAASINKAEKEHTSYILIDTCMDLLTKELRPSKYNYIRNILEEEFEERNQQLIESGLLQFEVINIIAYCQSVFDDLNFSEENEENRFLRYAITGVIKEYLDERTSENVKDGLQQSTKTEE